MNQDIIDYILSPDVLQESKIIIDYIYIIARRIARIKNNIMQNQLNIGHAFFFQLHPLTIFEVQ